MTARPRKISASCPRCSAVSARQRFFPGRAQPRLGRKNGPGFGCFSRGSPQPRSRIRASEFFQWATSVEPNIFRTRRPSLEIFSKSPSFLPSSSQKSSLFIEINEIFTGGEGHVNSSTAIQYIIRETKEILWMKTLDARIGRRG